jgi:hypothetical protein
MRWPAGRPGADRGFWPGGDVLPRLNAWGRRFADAYQALKRGARVAHSGDLHVPTREASAKGGTTLNKT